MSPAAPIIFGAPVVPMSCSASTLMSLRCLFGAHRPSLVSILKRKGGGWIGLCEGCDARIEQNEEGRWSLSEPLIPKK